MAPAIQTAPRQVGEFFQPASVQKKWLKVLLYGGTGTGKTYTSVMYFPGVYLIDTEGSSHAYAHRAKFQRFETMNPFEALDAIEALVAAKPADCETLVIDSLSVFSDQYRSAIGLHRADARAVKMGMDPYTADMKPADWNRVKAAWKDLLSRLMHVPLNLVLTCREAKEYADGGEMRQIGVKPAADNDVVYYPDVVIHLSRIGTGAKTRIRAEVEKERWGVYPLGHTAENIDWNFFTPIYELATAGAEPVASSDGEAGAAERMADRDATLSRQQRQQAAPRPDPQQPGGNGEERVPRRRFLPDDATPAQDRLAKVSALPFRDKATGRFNGRGWRAFMSYLTLATIKTGEDLVAATAGWDDEAYADAYAKSYKYRDGELIGWDGTTPLPEPQT